MGDDGDIRLTQLLEAAGGGDKEAARRVWKRVHTELHRMAVVQLARDGLRAVLRPTSMVAEAARRRRNVASL